MIVDNIQLQVSLDLSQATEQLKELQSRVLSASLGANSPTVNTSTSLLPSPSESGFKDTLVLAQRYITLAQKRNSLLEEIRDIFKKPLDVVIKGRGGYDSDLYGVPVAPSPLSPAPSTGAAFEAAPDYRANFSTLATQNQQSHALQNANTQKAISNRISVGVNLGNVLSLKLSELNKTVLTSSAAQTAAISKSTTTLQSATLSLKPNLIEKAFGTLKTAITAPLSLLSRGLGSVFNATTLEFAASVKNSLKGTEYGDKFQLIMDLFTDTFSRGMYQAATNFARYAGGYGRNNPAEIMSKDLGKNLSKLVDIGYLGNSIDRLTSFYATLQAETKNSPNATKEIMLAVGSAIEKKAPQQVKAAQNIIFQAAAFPVKFKNQVETANQAVLIKELVGNGKNLKAIATLSQYLTLQNADISKLDKVLLTVAGFQRSSGYKGSQISDMVSPVVQEGVTLVPIRNRDTDRSHSETPKSEIVNLLSDIFSNIGLGEQAGGLSALNNTFYNMEISLAKAFRGFDRDAVRMATVGHIVKTINPKAELGGVGFSGGGQIVKQFVAIMEKLGHSVQGVGIGTPTIGAATPTRGYRGVVSFSDEQAMYYDKQQLALTSTTKKMMVKGALKSGADTARIAARVPFNIPDEVKVSQTATNHNLSQYLDKDETYDLIQQGLPSFFKSLEERNNIKENSTFLVDLEAELVNLKKSLNELELIDLVAFQTAASTIEEAATTIEAAVTKSANGVRNIGLLELIKKDKATKATTKLSAQEVTEKNSKRKEEETARKEQVDKQIEAVRQERIKIERQRVQALTGNELKEYGKKTFPFALSTSFSSDIGKTKNLADTNSFGKSLDKIAIQSLELSSLKLKKEDTSSLSEEEKGALDARIKVLSHALESAAKAVSETLETLSRETSKGLWQSDYFKLVKQTNDRSATPLSATQLEAFKKQFKQDDPLPYLLGDKLIARMGKTLDFKNQILGNLNTSGSDLQSKHILAAIPTALTSKLKEFLLAFKTVQTETDQPAVDEYGNSQYSPFRWESAYNALGNKENLDGGGSLAGYNDAVFAPLPINTAHLVKSGLASEEDLDTNSLVSTAITAFEIQLKEMFKTKGNNKVSQEFLALSTEFFEAVIAGKKTTKSLRDNLRAIIKETTTSTTLSPEVITKQLKQKNFNDSAKYYVNANEIAETIATVKPVIAGTTHVEKDFASLLNELYENANATEGRNLKSLLLPLITKKKKGSLTQNAPATKADLANIQLVESVSQLFDSIFGKELPETLKPEDVKFIGEGAEGFVLLQKDNNTVIKIAKEQFSVLGAVAAALTKNSNVPVFKSLALVTKKLAEYFNQSLEKTSGAKLEDEMLKTIKASRLGLIHLNRPSSALTTTNTRNDYEVLGDNKALLMPKVEGNTATSLLLAGMQQMLSTTNNADKTQDYLNRPDLLGLLTPFLQIGANIRKFHDKGFDHGDANPNNIMIAGGLSTAIDLSHLTELPQLNTKGVKEAQLEYVRSLAAIKRSLLDKDFFGNFKGKLDVLLQTVPRASAVFSTINTILDKTQQSIASDFSKVITEGTNFTNIIDKIGTELIKLDAQQIESIFPSITKGLTQKEQLNIIPTYIREESQKNPLNVLPLLVAIINKIGSLGQAKEDTLKSITQQGDQLKTEILATVETAKEKLKEAKRQSTQALKLQLLTPNANDLKRLQDAFDYAGSDKAIEKAAEKQNTARVAYDTSLLKFNKPITDAKEKTIERAIKDALAVFSHKGVNISKDAVTALIRAGYNRVSLADDVSNQSPELIVEKTLKQFAPYLFDAPSVESSNAQTKELNDLFFGAFDNSTLTSPYKDTTNKPLNEFTFATANIKAGVVNLSGTLSKSLLAAITGISSDKKGGDDHNEMGTGGSPEPKPPTSPTTGLGGGDLTLTKPAVDESNPHTASIAGLTALAHETFAELRDSDPWHDDSKEQAKADEVVLSRSHGKATKRVTDIDRYTEEAAFLNKSQLIALKTNNLLSTLQQRINLATAKVTTSPIGRTVGGLYNAAERAENVVKGVVDDTLPFGGAAFAVTKRIMRTFLLGEVLPAMESAISGFSGTDTLINGIDTLLDNAASEMAEAITSNDVIGDALQEALEGSLDKFTDVISHEFAIDLELATAKSFPRVASHLAKTRSQQLERLEIKGDRTRNLRGVIAASAELYGEQDESIRKSGKFTGANLVDSKVLAQTLITAIKTLYPKEKAYTTIHKSENLNQLYKALNKDNFSYAESTGDRRMKAIALNYIQLLDSEINNYSNRLGAAVSLRTSTKENVQLANTVFETKIIAVMDEVSQALNVLKHGITQDSTKEDLTRFIEAKSLVLAYKQASLTKNDDNKALLEPLARRTAKYESGDKRLLKSRYTEINKLDNSLLVQISNYLGTKSNQTSNKILDTLGKDQGLFLSKNIINGLVIGLKEKKADATKAMEALALGQIEAANKILGIHSPSKAFQYIGQMVVQGFKQGLSELEIEDYITKVIEEFPQDAMTAARNATFSAVLPQIAQISQDARSPKTLVRNKGVQGLVSNIGGAVASSAAVGGITGSLAADLVGAISTRVLLQLVAAEKYGTVTATRKRAKLSASVSRRDLADDAAGWAVGNSSAILANATLDSLAENPIAAAARHIPFKGMIASIAVNPTLLEKSGVNRYADKSQNKSIEQLNNARPIGKAISDGIRLGVETVRLNQLMTSTGHSMLVAMRQVLGIHSPSDEFIDIGEQIVRGLDIGQKQSPEVFDYIPNKMRHSLMDIKQTLALFERLRTPKNKRSEGAPVLNTVPLEQKESEDTDKPKEKSRKPRKNYGVSIDPNSRTRNTYSNYNFGDRILLPTLLISQALLQEAQRALSKVVKTTVTQLSLGVKSTKTSFIDISTSYTVVAQKIKQLAQEQKQRTNQFGASLKQVLSIKIPLDTLKQTIKTNIEQKKADLSLKKREILERVVTKKDSVISYTTATKAKVISTLTSTKDKLEANIFSLSNTIEESIERVSNAVKATKHSLESNVNTQRTSLIDKLKQAQIALVTWYTSNTNTVLNLAEQIKIKASLIKPLIVSAPQNLSQFIKNTSTKTTNLKDKTIQLGQNQVASLINKGVAVQSKIYEKYQSSQDFIKETPQKIQQFREKASTTTLDFINSSKNKVSSGINTAKSKLDQTENYLLKQHDKLGDILANYSETILTNSRRLYTKQIELSTNLENKILKKHQQLGNILYNIADNFTDKSKKILKTSRTFITESPVKVRQFTKEFSEKTVNLKDNITQSGNKKLNSLIENNRDVVTETPKKVQKAVENLYSNTQKSINLTKNKATSSFSDIKIRLEQAENYFLKQYSAVGDSLIKYSEIIFNTSKKLYTKQIELSTKLENKILQKHEQLGDTLSNVTDKALDSVKNNIFPKSKLTERGFIGRDRSYRVLVNALKPETVKERQELQSKVDQNTLAVSLLKIAIVKQGLATNTKRLTTTAKNKTLSGITTVKAKIDQTENYLLEQHSKLGDSLINFSENITQKSKTLYKKQVALSTVLENKILKKHEQLGDVLSNVPSKIVDKLKNIQLPKLTTIKYDLASTTQKLVSTSKDKVSLVMDTAKSKIEQIENYLLKQHSKLGDILAKYSEIILFNSKKLYTKQIDLSTSLENKILQKHGQLGNALYSITDIVVRKASQPTKRAVDSVLKEKDKTTTETEKTKYLAEGKKETSPSQYEVLDSSSTKLLNKYGVDFSGKVDRIDDKDLTPDFYRLLEIAKKTGLTAEHFLKAITGFYKTKGNITEVLRELYHKADVTPPTETQRTLSRLPLTPFDKKGAFNIPALKGVPYANALAGIASEKITQETSKKQLKLVKGFNQFDLAVTQLFDSLTESLTRKRKQNVTSNISTALGQVAFSLKDSLHIPLRALEKLFPYFTEAFSKLSPVVDLLGAVINNTISKIKPFGNSVQTSLAALGKAVNTTLVVSSAIAKSTVVNTSKLLGTFISSGIGSGFNIVKNIGKTAVNSIGSLASSTIPSKIINTVFSVSKALKKQPNYTDEEFQKPLDELRAKRQTIPNFDSSQESTILWGILVEKLEKLKNSILLDIETLDALIQDGTDEKGIQDLEKAIKTKKSRYKKLEREIFPYTEALVNQKEVKTNTPLSSSSSLFNQFTGLITVLTTAIAGVVALPDGAAAESLTDNPIIQKAEGYQNFFKDFSGDFGLSSLGDFGELIQGTLQDLSSVVNIPFIGNLIAGLGAANTVLGVTGGLLDGFKNNSAFKPLIGQAFDFLSTLQENASNLTVFGLRLGGIAQIAGTLGIVAATFKTFGSSIKAAVLSTGELTNKLKIVERLRGSRASQDINSIFTAASRSGNNKLEALDVLKEFSSASIGTSLDANIAKYAGDFLEASKASGISSEAQKSAIQAVTQTISKGKLYSEELRGQLAEHLPSAIPVAARSLGYESVPAFLEELSGEQGISATTFLPSFTAGLKSNAVTQNTDTLPINIDKLNSTIVDLQLSIGSIFEGLANEGTKWATGFIKAITPIASALTAAFLPLVGGSLLTGVANLTSAGSSLGKVWRQDLKGVFTGVGTALDGLASKSTRFFGSVGNLLKGIGTSLALAFSIVVLQEAFAQLNNIQGSLTDSFKQAEKLKVLLAKPTTGTPSTPAARTETKVNVNAQDKLGDGLLDSVRGLLNKASNSLTFNTNKAEKNTDSTLSIIAGERTAPVKRFIGSGEHALAQAIVNANALSDEVFSSVTAASSEIPKIQKNIDDLVLKNQTLITKKAVTPLKGERSRIQEEIQTNEAAQATEKERLTVQIEAINSGKSILSTAANKILEDAAALGYEKEKGVLGAFNVLMQTSGLLGRYTTKNLSVIAGLTDSLSGMEKGVVKLTTSLAVFTREITRRKGEKIALADISDPYSDKAGGLATQQTNLRVAKSIYKASAATRNKKFDALKDEDITKQLVARRLNVNTDLSKIDELIGDSTTSKEVVKAATILKSYIEQREETATKLTDYANAFKELRITEYNFLATLPLALQGIKNLSGEIERSVTKKSNQAKRDFNRKAIGNSGIDRAKVDSELEQVELKERVVLTEQVISKSQTSLKSKPAINSLKSLAKWSIGFNSSIEELSTALSTLPLNLDDQNVIQMLIELKTQEANLDGYITQLSSSARSLLDRVFDWAKGLASTLNGLQDGWIAAKRGLEDTQIQSLVKLRGIRNQITQKASELLNLQLDLRTSQSKSSLLGSTDTNSLVTSAIDSYANLEKAKISQSSSLEQAQFELDQKLFDSQQELINAQRELVSAIRQGRITEEQNLIEQGQITPFSPQFNSAIGDPVVDQAKALEALNLPNVKVIWNTAQTPIKTTINTVDSVIKAKDSGIKGVNVYDKINQVIALGKEDRANKEDASILARLNSVFSAGDNAIVTAITSLQSVIQTLGFTQNKSANLTQDVKKPTPSTNITRTNAEYDAIKQDFLEDGSYIDASYYSKVKSPNQVDKSYYSNVGKGKAIDIEFGDGSLPLYKNRQLPPDNLEGTLEERQAAYTKDPKAYFLLDLVQKVLGKNTPIENSDALTLGQNQTALKFGRHPEQIVETLNNDLVIKSTADLLQLEAKFKKLLFDTSPLTEPSYSINSLKAANNKEKPSNSKYDVYSLDSSSLALNTPTKQVTNDRNTLSDKIKKVFSGVESTDSYTVEETLGYTQETAIDEIQRLLKETNIFNQKKYDNLFQRVGKEKVLNTELFNKDTDVINTRYSIEEQNYINENKKRTRTYQIQTEEKERRLPARDLEILNRQSSFPQNQGLAAYSLQNDITKQTYALEIESSQGAAAVLQLEIEDKRDELVALETLKASQTGSIAEETEKQISYLQTSIQQSNSLLQKEEQLLTLLQTNQTPTEDRLNKKLALDTQGFNLAANRFQLDDNYAAAEILNTEDYEPSRFKRDDVSRQIQERRELITYLERENQIKQKALELNYTESQTDNALSASTELYEANMIRIQDSTNTLASLFKETLSAPISDFFTNLITGSESLGTSVTNLATGVLKSLASMASQMITNYLLSQLLGSVFGFGGGGGGGAASGIIGAIFDSGGTVGKNHKGQGLSIAEGYKKEKAFGNGQPILAYLTKGEEVLSQKNGDAQHFRQLKQTGAWEASRLSSFNTESAINTGSSSFRLPQAKSVGATTTIINQTKFDVTTHDVRSFSKSREQLESEANNRMRRSTRFKG